MVRFQVSHCSHVVSDMDKEKSMSKNTDVPNVVEPEAEKLVSFASFIEIELNI